MNRRRVLALAAAASSSGFAAGGRNIGLGANTAIAGMGFFDAVKLLREIGFAVIEIQAMGKLEPVAGEFPGYQFDKLTGEEKQRVKTALGGVERVTAHLPYTGLDYFSPDKSTAEAARKVVETAIEGSGYFGAVTSVAHPKAGAGLTAGQQWPEMIRVFRQWGDVARGHGMKLALETGFPKSVKEFVSLIREIDHPAVGATLDVGHQAGYEELAGIAAQDRASARAIRAYNDVNLQLVEGLGRRLLHLHVHDIEPSTWKEHRPMGTGFIDYRRLVAKLRAIGFDGSLVLEIGAPAGEMPEDLRQAKKVMEGYLRG